MQRKQIPDLRPLTPDFARYLARPLTKTELEKLQSENRKLRAQLAYEKSKHERIESALARHLASLEKTLTTTQEAVRLLGRELRPSEKK